MASASWPNLSFGRSWESTSPDSAAQSKVSVVRRTVARGYTNSRMIGMTKMAPTKRAKPRRLPVALLAAERIRTLAPAQRGPPGRKQ